MTAHLTLSVEAAGPCGWVEDMSEHPAVLIDELSRPTLLMVQRAA
jgi:hypothetical protein